MSEQVLDPAAQEALAHIARLTIEAAVRREPGPPASFVAEQTRRHPSLCHPAGAFVTVYVAGELRGCLGEIEPEDSLAHVVIRCARKTPLCDYRFDMIRPEELETLTFKISILSAPEQITDVGKIEIGRHGLIVRHEGRAGLLLPDVALEYHWDVPTFLDHLWRKAGLERSTPVEAVGLWTFTTQIISGTECAATRMADPAEVPSPSDDNKA